MVLRGEDQISIPKRKLDIFSNWICFDRVLSQSSSGSGFPAILWHLFFLPHSFGKFNKFNSFGRFDVYMLINAFVIFATAVTLIVHPHWLQLLKLAFHPLNSYLFECFGRILWTLWMVTTSTHKYTKNRLHVWCQQSPTHNHQSKCQPFKKVDESPCYFFLLALASPGGDFRVLATVIGRGQTSRRWFVCIFFFYDGSFDRMDVSSVGLLRTLHNQGQVDGTPGI